MEERVKETKLRRPTNKGGCIFFAQKYNDIFLFRPKIACIKRKVIVGKDRRLLTRISRTRRYTLIMDVKRLKSKRKERKKREGKKFLKRYIVKFMVEARDESIPPVMRETKLVAREQRSVEGGLALGGGRGDEHAESIGGTSGEGGGGGSGRSHLPVAEGGGGGSDDGDDDDDGSSGGK